MLILALCFLLFIDTLGIGIVTPVFAPLFTLTNSTFHANWFVQQWPGAIYALMIAIPMICMVLGSPLLGTLSDRYGRKKILLFGLAGVGFSFIVSIMGLLYSSLTLLLIGRIMVGLMDGSQSVAQAAIADLSTLENKTKNMGYATLSITMGFVVGPILGGIFSDHHLANWFSYETPFIIATVLSAINIIVLKYSFQETFIPANVPVLKVKKIFHDIFIATLDPRVRSLSIMFLILQIVWSTCFQVTSLIAETNFHYTNSEIGYYMAFIGGIFSLSMILIIKIFIDRFSNTTLLRASFLIAMLGLLLFAFMPTNVMLWLSIIPIAAGVAIIYNLLIAMFSNAVSSQEQGWMMGGVTGLVAVGWFLGSALTGLLNQQLTFLFIFLAVLFGIAYYILSQMVKTSMA